MTAFTRILLSVVLLAALTASAVPAQAAPLPQDEPPQVGASPSSVTGARTVNAPYFAVSDVTGEKFPEMAIFWFGKVTSTENYTDVRVGYNDTALVVMAQTFDRRVWYDLKHDPAKLIQYDSVSLYLNTAAPSTYPTAKAFRFDAQMSWYEDRAGYQLAYRGTGSTWKRDDSISFVSERGYAGGQFNNNEENRGWAMKFIIPFTSLGLEGRPADLTQWGLSLVMHDRDGKPGSTAVRNRPWPENSSGTRPKTWGRLTFGLPSYTPPAYSPGDTLVVRHKLNGQVVTDAGVGGDMGHLCDDSALWTRWGLYNFSGRNSVNIQNQSNLHDWPCFTKFYVTFPLTKMPKGKVIISAKLVLHEWGGSDWQQALPSLIQVFTLKNNWSEGTINWNNAPVAQENVAQTWVDPVPHAIESSEWPGWRYEWDVSRAVADAYKAGVPLRLALYEADDAYHSGKYFSTSQADDWNAEARPTLIIEWGNQP